MSDRDPYRVLNVRPDAHQLVIQAAYRVLAALYHPDRGESLASTRRMADLNDAYAMVRTAEARAAYEAERQHKSEAGPSVVVPPTRTARRPPKATRAERGATIDFGRYEGWTIRDVAGRDPDYLRWLSRHSAGMRFRSEITEVLSHVAPGTSASEKVFGPRR